MYDPDDYFSDDINSEYWDDVYYDETHPEYSSYSGPRYGGGSRSSGHSPWFWAFVVGMIFAFIAPSISGKAFIITLIIAIAKKLIAQNKCSQMCPINHT